MEKAFSLKQQVLDVHEKSANIVNYPAVADSIDLPDVTFYKNKDKDAFVLLPTEEQKFNIEKNKIIINRLKTLGEVRLITLLAPMWQEIKNSQIVFNIISQRAALLKIKNDGANVVIDAHWNLFVPYFYRIKELPIVHAEILNIFADAVFNYAALAMRHQNTNKSKLRSLAIDAYLGNPQFLLASLDIFNKPNIYHIRPTRIWLNRISAANDEHRLQIEVSVDAVATPTISPEFIEEVTGFIHKIVKNYAFRYVDYLWTQQYKIIFNMQPDMDIVTCEDNNIAVDIHSLIVRNNWKPTLYLNLGHAIMLAILKSSGSDDNKENIHLAMMKTWNRYLSYDESCEKQSVRELYGVLKLPEEGQNRRLLECMISKDSHELIDDFIMLMDYSAKETFVERLKALNESHYGRKTGVYYEQLWNSIRSLNTDLMRNNINYSKLIEVLRNDNIDHLQLAELLRTGRLDGRCVVDVSEWLLLRTLLYDLINAPKVFRNDYKMLLKILTKVNKTLIVYVWTLILDNDVRYELVNAYIAKLINDIFVFDRIKIYEIVADPVECLEAEAVTGYLLNWASLSLEEWRSIVNGVLSGLPRNVVTHLSIQTANDVDQLIRAMKIRASGLIGFCLHQAYRWGSTHDELTERIRSYFPELLKQAQKAILPKKMIMGGAMLLLILAQIISDERDGFAKNIVITEKERQMVFDLIKQCVNWDQRHFVIMVGGIAVGYTGTIDGWTLQQFDTLMGRYGGGDRVVLRSVVQFDVENLIERALTTAKEGENISLLNKIQFLRLGVDPVISDQANKYLGSIASRYGIHSPEFILKRKDIRNLVLDLSQCMKSQRHCMQ